MTNTDLQMRARMSPLPVANSPPMGLGATDITVYRGLSLANTAQTTATENGISHPAQGWHADETHARTGVLVTLEHQLGVTSSRVPKLDTAILRPTQNPLAVWCKRNAQDKVLEI